MKIKYTLLFLLSTTALPGAEDPCQQPPPAEMAKAAGVDLPRLPWHTVNIWWRFKEPVTKFTSLEVDITIDRDVSDDYNLYVSPCGGAHMNGQMFYGGLQSNINGWENMGKESKERVHPGKGVIFSRWSNDKKTPIGLDHVRTAGDDCLVESAGYEGEFASVRRPFNWTKGTYTYRIMKGASETVDGKDCTWFDCSLKDFKGVIHEVGSLRFEGAEFTFADYSNAFVEVYKTSKIPNPGIPKVRVTFSWPRMNGSYVPLEKAFAYHRPPSDEGTSSSPDCAKVTVEGGSCVVEVGEIFKRDPSKQKYDLELVRPAD